MHGERAERPLEVEAGLFVTRTEFECGEERVARALQVPTLECEDAEVVVGDCGEIEVRCAEPDDPMCFGCQRWLVGKGTIPGG